MNTIELTAPSHWAPYIVNGDASGMSQSERDACEAWLTREGVQDAIDCVEIGFLHSHDARSYALAADCCLYTFPTD